MIKKILLIFGIIITIGVGTVLYCCYTDICDCFFEPFINSKSKTTLNTTKLPFSISDPNGTFNVNVADNFNFEASEFEISDSISKDLNNAALKLKTFLESDASKSIDIYGHYKTAEINTSIFSNMGMARANAVKNYLIGLGIPSKQITIGSQLNDAFEVDDTGKFFGPFKYSITTDTSNKKEDALLTAACEAVKTDPLVLYFISGQSKTSLSQNQRKKIEAISECVSKLDLKIQVIGHTDDRSDEAYNYTLGLKRAEFTKAYLIKNGILEALIETSSKGETEPIYTNNTNIGRSGNRRTIITIN